MQLFFSSRLSVVVAPDFFNDAQLEKGKAYARKDQQYMAYAKDFYKQHHAQLLLEIPFFEK